MNKELILSEATVYASMSHNPTRTSATVRWRRYTGAAELHSDTIYAAKEAIDRALDRLIDAVRAEFAELTRVSK